MGVTEAENGASGNLGEKSKTFGNVVEDREVEAGKSVVDVEGVAGGNSGEEPKTDDKNRELDNRESVSNAEDSAGGNLWARLKSAVGGILSEESNNSRQTAFLATAPHMKLTPHQLVEQGRNQE